MDTNAKARPDYGPLLIAGVVMLTVSQALDGATDPAISFIRGMLIGLSLVSNLVGLYLYSISRR